MRYRFHYRIALAVLAHCLVLGVMHPSKLRAAAAGAEESRINGRWKWSLTMPDGSVVSPTARLRFDGQGLTGTSRFRHATETAISGGRFTGDKLEFDVVRNIRDRRVVTHYSGTFSGDTIRGVLESDWTGKSQSYEWVAKRLPDSPEGTWKWATQVHEHSVEYSIKLKQDGDKLSGKLTARKGLGVDVKHGRFKGEEVSFEADREREGERFVSKFRGRLVGDVIRGQETVIQGKEERVHEWIAIRAD